jgi:hypothetical protein
MREAVVAWLMHDNASHARTLAVRRTARAASTRLANTHNMIDCNLRKQLNLWEGK